MHLYLICKDTFGTEENSVWTPAASVQYIANHELLGASVAFGQLRVLVLVVGVDVVDVFDHRGREVVALGAPDFANVAKSEATEVVEVGEFFLFEAS